MPMTASSPPASEAQLAWAQPEVPIDESRADVRMAAFRAQRQLTPQQFIATQDQAHRLQYSPEEWTAYLARQSDEAVAARQRALPKATSKPPGLPAPKSSLQAPPAPPSPGPPGRNLGFLYDKSDSDLE